MNFKTYDIKSNGEIIAEPKTYEEAIIALYRLHNDNPKRDLYIREYHHKTDSRGVYIDNKKTIEIDILGKYENKFAKHFSIGG